MLGENRAKGLASDHFKFDSYNKLLATVTSLIAKGGYSIRRGSISVESAPQKANHFTIQFDLNKYRMGTCYLLAIVL